MVTLTSHLYRKYKKPFCCWQGTNLLIFLRSAEDFQTALTDQRCLGKADLYKLLPFDSLGTVEGKNKIWQRKNKTYCNISVEKWRKRRKLIQPSFNPKFLTSFMGIFNTRTLECIKELEEFVGDEKCEISHKLRTCLTTILCGKKITGYNIIQFYTFYTRDFF